MAEQANGEYEARDLTMSKYLDMLQTIMEAFEYFNISHMPREENIQVNTLSQLVTSTANSLDRIYVKYLDTPNINNVGKIQQINDKPSWIDPIIKYLIEKNLPRDLKAKWIRWTASQYVLLGK